MEKVNQSLLQCIHPGCDVIPTVVLEFRHPSGMRVMGQVITCPDHRQEGIEFGDARYGRNNLSTGNYPNWLRRVHTKILDENELDGQPVNEDDMARLRAAVCPRPH
jgi:hypothetical protein